MATRTLTEEHKAAMLAGKREAEERERENKRIQSAEFRAWSERHAKVWADWQMHCGRAQHDCDYCKDYRAVTSGIPTLRRHR
jgi:3'-phosphoadenosine 5'-phosphosulfate sulfotransferase (PAPS reductase)/FAD synthetase